MLYDRAHPPRRDEHYGFQLYQSDPSGNYGGWKATAIGAGHQAANNLLKSDYKEDTTMAEVCGLLLSAPVHIFPEHFQ